jgi:hypothetical protein
MELQLLQLVLKKSVHIYLTDYVPAAIRIRPFQVLGMQVLLSIASRDHWKKTLNHPKTLALKYMHLTNGDSKYTPATGVMCQ